MIGPRTLCLPGVHDARFRCGSDERRHSNDSSKEPRDHNDRGARQAGEILPKKTHLLNQQSLANSGGWVSQPCRAACLSKAAVQRRLSLPTSVLRVGADSGCPQVVPMHHGGEGFTTPDAAGHKVAAISGVRLRRCECRRPLPRSRRPSEKTVRKVETPCRLLLSRR
jgi:hypothetical protein